LLDWRGLVAGNILVSKDLRLYSSQKIGLSS
jgi:hypothetical protein